MNVKKYTEPSFVIYISRILKNLQPDMSLSIDVKRYLQKLIISFLEHFVIYANVIMDHNRSKTLYPRDIQSAIRLFLVGELGKHAISHATKAVTKFKSFVPKNGARVSIAEKAGIILPPSRIRHILENKLTDYKSDFRISSLTPVYLATIIEYLIAEILDLSGDRAINYNRDIIQIEDVKNIIENDNELSRTLCRLNNLKV